MLHHTNHLDCSEVLDGIIFKIRVQPRSSRNAITGTYEGCLKVCLNSPPVDGEANKACIQLFSTLFGISKSKVTIIAGEKNRNKTLKVLGKKLVDFKQLVEKNLFQNSQSPP